MLFHEIYGRYFRTVSAILSEAVQHRLTGPRINELVCEKAFAESGLTIPAALGRDWPLLREDLTTPLHHEPSMPVTTLQKRWLKTLLQDPRIQLFAPDPTGLDQVEPLFELSDVVRFDQYSDGDPYRDPEYIEVFRTVLAAIHEHRKVRVLYRARDRRRSTLCAPYRLEYSEKDDKFRLLAGGGRSSYVFNLSRMERCELLEPVDWAEYHKKSARPRTLTFRLTDERNALNRVLLHFSHFEKETVKLNDREYEVTLKYDRDDETELLIRILSFGPIVRVVAPARFIALVRQRLERQQALCRESS